MRRLGSLVVLLAFVSFFALGAGQNQSKKEKIRRVIAIDKRVILNDSMKKAVRRGKEVEIGNFLKEGVLPVESIFLQTGTIYD